VFRAPRDVAIKFRPLRMYGNCPVEVGGLATQIKGEEGRGSAAQKTFVFRTVGVPRCTPSGPAYGLQKVDNFSD